MQYFYALKREKSTSVEYFHADEWFFANWITFKLKNIGSSFSFIWSYKKKVLCAAFYFSQILPQTV